MDPHFIGFDTLNDAVQFVFGKDKKKNQKIEKLKTARWEYEV